MKRIYNIQEGFFNHANKSNKQKPVLQNLVIYTERSIKDIKTTAKKLLSGSPTASLETAYELSDYDCCEVQSISIEDPMVFENSIENLDEFEKTCIASEDISPVSVTSEYPAEAMKIKMADVARRLSEKFPNAIFAVNVRYYENADPDYEREEYEEIYLNGKILQYEEN